MKKKKAKKDKKPKIRGLVLAEIAIVDEIKRRVNELGGIDYAGLAPLHLALRAVRESMAMDEDTFR